MILNSSPIIGFLDIIKEYNKNNLVVAEIGTYVGATTVKAASLVKHFKGNYIAIDWFQGSPGTEGVHYNSTLDNKPVFDIFMDNIKEVGVDDIVKVYNTTSLEAANLIPDKSLDICFIDADHKYNAIKADINAYLPKIKPGGIICGHDFEPPAINFIDHITETELDYDYTSRQIFSQNYIVQTYNGYIINSQIIRTNPELYYYHPGVVKAVSECFDKNDIKFYSDTVWAVKVI